MKTNRSYLSRSMSSLRAAARLCFYSARSLLFLLQFPEEFLYRLLSLVSSARCSRTDVKLSIVETVHWTKTDYFLAQSHMVSVNEQSSPILDVEHGPVRSKEMRLTVLDLVALLYIILLRNISIYLFFLFYEYIFRNFEILYNCMKHFTIQCNILLCI